MKIFAFLLERKVTPSTCHALLYLYLKVCRTHTKVKQKFLILLLRLSRRTLGFPTHGPAHTACLEQRRTEAM